MRNSNWKKKIPVIWGGFAAPKWTVFCSYARPQYPAGSPSSWGACIFYTNINGSYVWVFERESTPRLGGKFMCRSVSLFPRPVQGEIEI